METEYLQLGAIGIICVVLIREIFGYIKSRKNNSYPNYDKELVLINQKLDNHIAHICEAMIDIKGDIKNIKDDIIDIKIKLK